MNAMDLLNQDLKPKLKTGTRFLFVGRSGSGKENAAVSFPKRMYEFDCDNRFSGALSAVNWIGPDEFKKIDFDFYNPKDGFIAIDDKLTNYHNMLEKRQTELKTIIISSVGSLAALLALDSQKLRGMSKKDDGGFKGKTRGKVEFLHPDDYNYVSTAFRFLTFERFFPMSELGCNIILTAWVADRWGKKAGAGEYDPPVVIGEKVLAPGNFVEEVVGYFDEVYYFRKHPGIIGKPPRYTVEFNGPSLAKSALGLPTGEVDITGRSFHTAWYNLVTTGNVDGKEEIGK